MSPRRYKKDIPAKNRDIFFGGDGGIRTLDLTDANRTLSQLSYAPIYVCAAEKTPSTWQLKHYNTYFSFVKKKCD